MRHSPSWTMHDHCGLRPKVNPAIPCWVQLSSVACFCHREVPWMRFNRRLQVRQTQSSVVVLALLSCSTAAVCATFAAAAGVAVVVVVVVVAAGVTGCYFCCSCWCASAGK